MTIIKRSRNDSTADLIQALQVLIPLVKNQKEDEAAATLEECVGELQKAAPGSAGHKAAIEKVIDAFEGDHELIAYTFKSKGSEGQWTETEELFLASSRVLSLARRMQ